MDKNNNKPRKWLAWLAVGLVALVIFCFSAQPNSAEFTYRFLGDWNNLARPLAHMTEFAVLFLSLKWALGKTVPGAGFIGPCLIALIICGAYAYVDEWHQSFVPGRTSSLLHVRNDMIGAGIACSISTVSELSRRWLKRKR